MIDPTQTILSSLMPYGKLVFVVWVGWLIQWSAILYQFDVATSEFEAKNMSQSVFDIILKTH